MPEAVDKSNLMPRYLQVKDILERMVRSGEIRPGDRIPSERDLAKSLDVSQMTVNKAVGLMVREGWLRRELGNGTFVRQELQLPPPSVVAVGFAIPAPSEALDEDYFFGALLRGIRKASVGRPLSLRLLDDQSRALTEAIAEAEVDGCIVVDLRGENLAAIEGLARQGRRVVVLGGHDGSLDAPVIDGDNYAGAAEAVAHLLSLGHTRIAGLFALMESWHSKQRHRAFVETLANASIATDDRLVVFDEGDGRRLAPDTAGRLSALFQTEKPPTALFCGGFFLALEAMNVIRGLDLRIPADVSIVGYDDPSPARYLVPPLTTVRQPLEEMGERSVVQLYDWIRQGVEPPKRTIFEESLVVRSSTIRAAPRRDGPR
jgi:GntR family transcriptional regulator of arabinose operon